MLIIKMPWGKPYHECMRADWEDAMILEVLQDDDFYVVQRLAQLVRR
jgi:hypothetical protein